MDKALLAEKTQPPSILPKPTSVSHMVRKLANTTTTFHHQVRQQQQQQPQHLQQLLVQQQQQQQQQETRCESNREDIANDAKINFSSFIENFENLSRSRSQENNANFLSRSKSALCRKNRFNLFPDTGICNNKFEASNNNDNTDNNNNDDNKNNNNFNQSSSDHNDTNDKRQKTDKNIFSAYRRNNIEPGNVNKNSEIVAGCISPANSINKIIINNNNNFINNNTNNNNINNNNKIVNINKSKSTSNSSINKQQLRSNSTITTLQQ
ncbi:hypothetical protein HELRODRAFT_175727 [Helobdella robusta]|uniref:Uncharacterized protein n=1 Tax=Helobdella robusta TaxID=6412 RepID=T1F9L0_HELRO|nr:hypothetical protein HELRODRAFT_175727 [Helobdella robusta]ESO00736.1 hypothetical protein HELRODRAFT_175727 [Helobdella robusta]